MPIYHFDVEGRTDDSESRVEEFRDLAEAKREALKLAGTLIADSAGTFWNNPKWMLIVTDDTGGTLFQLQVLGAEGPAERNLSRTGFGEGTFDKVQKADANDSGVDGS